MDIFGIDGIFIGLAAQGAAFGFEFVLDWWHNRKVMMTYERIK